MRDFTTVLAWRISMCNINVFNHNMILDEFNRLNRSVDNVIRLSIKVDDINLFKSELRPDQFVEYKLSPYQLIVRTYCQTKYFF